MDQGEEIRFRVTDEVFVDTSPTGPSAAEKEAPAQPGQVTTSVPKEENKEKKEAPYTLIVRTYLQRCTFSHTHKDNIIKFRL